MNRINPSTLFGGTWEQIKDTFLLSAGDNYTGGSTGCEAEHTLTVDEMPSHKHVAPVYKSGSTDFQSGLNYSSGGSTNSSFVQATGGSQAHNNMPPYLTVYMWKRIA